MELLEQVKILLEERFPSATVDLWQDAYSGKISGHLVWGGFDGEEQLDRQQQVYSWLHQNLGPRTQSLSAILTYSTQEHQVMSLA